MEASVNKTIKKRIYPKGYRKPIKDDSGKEICVCITPQPFNCTGEIRCLKCFAIWYH